METMVKKQPVEPVMPVIDESALPDGWALKTIGEVCEKAEKVDPTANPDAEFRYIDIGGIDNQLLRIVDAKTYLGKDAPSRARQLVKANDVVISTVRTYLKNIALVPDDLDGQVASTGFCVLRSSDMWMGKYLYYFVQSDAVLKEIGKQQRGTSYPAVRDSDIKAQFIPVPPKREVRRIVEAIELQLGRLDAAVARLQGAKARLKRYKQAVLKAAVEGRLTEEWREKNPDVIPADEALSSNLTKRRLDWEQAKLKEFGKPPRTNAWKEKYKEPPTIETEELPDLPEGWTWVGLEQVAAAGAHALKAGPFGSALKKEFYVAKGYKVYGQEQVISGDPYFGDYYIDEDRFDSLKACAVKPGDLLISLVGTIGRVLILPADIEPGIINPRLVKISLDTSVILPEYLKAYLESPYAKYLFSLSTHGGTMEILNLGILKELPIPLPPIKEQQMLLQIMDKVSSSDNEVETTLDAQLQQAVRLRQAVLKRAFEGRLV